MKDAQQETKQTRKQSVSGFTKVKRSTYWWSREVLAFSGWAYITTKLLFFDPLAYSVHRWIPSLSVFLPYIPLSLLVMLCVLWIIYDGKRVLQDIFYFIVYPWTLLFRLTIRAVTRHWTYLVVFAPMIYDTARTFRSYVVRHTLALLAIICIFVSSRESYLVPAMLVLGVLLIYHMAASLRRAFSPSVFDRLLDVIRNFRFRLDEKTFLAKILHAKETGIKSQTARQEDQAPFLLYLAHSISDIISKEVQRIVRSRKIEMCLVLWWTWSYVVTVFVYSLIYYGLHKCHSTAFTGDALWGYWSFLGFSFSKLSCAGISTLQPSETLPVLVCYTEAVCGIVILVILFFVFLTAARERYRKVSEEIVDELNLCTTTLDHKFPLLLQMARADAELIFMQSQGSLINKLRKLRQLEALPIPVTDVEPQKSVRP